MNIIRLFVDKKYLKLTGYAVALTLLTACEGLFHDIYDNNKIRENVESKEGQFYVDASSWTHWYYIDFKKLGTNEFKLVEMSIPTDEVSNSKEKSGIYTYWYDVYGKGITNNEYRSFTPTAPQPEPEQWDIAIHRHNVRTNGGAVFETSYTSIADLPESSSAFANAQFTNDEWNENWVWTVQDKMLLGFIGNQGIKINNVLSSWIKIDLPPIPPAFTMNNHVFIIRMADGTYAALQLENYQSTSGKKCCFTVNYKYPY